VTLCILSAISLLSANLSVDRLGSREQRSSNLTSTETVRNASRSPLLRRLGDPSPDSLGTMVHAVPAKYSCQNRQPNASLHLTYNNFYSLLTIVRLAMTSSNFSDIEPRETPHFPVWQPPFWFPVVGRCRALLAVLPLEWAWSEKLLGSHWNFSDISFQSRDTPCSTDVRHCCQCCHLIWHGRKCVIDKQLESSFLPLLTITLNRIRGHVCGYIEFWECHVTCLKSSSETHIYSSPTTLYHGIYMATPLTVREYASVLLAHPRSLYSYF